MIGVIFSIMTSALIASNGDPITGRPQTLVFKIGRFSMSNSNTSITYELNLTGIHNPTGAKLVLGDVSENGVVVADLLQPDSSKTKDKKLGTLLTGSITDTSPQGSMKGKSLSELITAMRDGSTYVYIDTPKGEIREQIKIPALNKAGAYHPPQLNPPQQQALLGKVQANITGDNDTKVLDRLNDRGINEQSIESNDNNDTKVPKDLSGLNDNGDGPTINPED